MKMTSSKLIQLASERLGFRYLHLVRQTLDQWKGKRLVDLHAGLCFAVAVARRIGEGLEGYSAGTFGRHDRCLLHDNSLLVYGFGNGKWSVACDGKWESCWPCPWLELNDDDAKILDARFFGVEPEQL